MTNAPFGLLVRFTLKQGTEAAFDQLVSETLAEIRSHEPGTLVYACHQVEERPQERVFYELYQDREAFDRHEQQQHIKRFLAEREQYLAKVEVDFLSVSAAKGLPAADVSA